MVHPGQTLESGLPGFHNGVPGRIQSRDQRIDGTVVLILGQRHGEITPNLHVFFRVGGAFCNEGDQIRHVHPLGKDWPPPVALPGGWKPKPFGTTVHLQVRRVEPKPTTRPLGLRDQGRPPP